MLIGHKAGLRLRALQVQSSNFPILDQQSCSGQIDVII
jgi:hypothetical protein